MKRPRPQSHRRRALMWSLFQIACKPGISDWPALFLAPPLSPNPLFFRGSEWLWGPNWLQTWLRLKLSLRKWQGADLPAWHWAIGHHSWQMCSGTKVAGCWGRQNAFSHSCFFFFFLFPLRYHSRPTTQLIKTLEITDSIITFLEMCFSNASRANMKNK